MRFKDRDEAARMLVECLELYRGRQPLVLGVPRGAVPMARVIADALGGDLDVVLVRKLRAPEHPELAIGAVDERGAILKSPYIDFTAGDDISEEVRRELEILRMRRALYTQARPQIDPAGRVVIIVDDGNATGSSMLAAIRSVRARKPQKIIVATAVAPAASLNDIRREADQVVCLHAAHDFCTAGQFFDNLSEINDDEVVRALREARAVATVTVDTRTRALAAAGPTWRGRA